MDLLHELVALALHASLLLLALSIGLDIARGDGLYVLRRPRLLLRALLALVVVVPLVAALLVALLPLKESVEIAIVLMAVSPLPPVALPREIRSGGRKPYAYGLLVAIGVLSIVTVPAAVAILAWLFNAHAVVAPLAVSPLAVAQLVFVSLFVPLGLGLGLRALAPGPAAHAAPVVSKVAVGLLALACLPVLVTAAPELARLVGDGTVLVILAVVLAGLVAGHLLGGPEPHDRVALALSSATRHPGIAMLVASANSMGSEVRATVLLFVIVGLLAAVPYQLWLRRHALVPQ
ncbi:hypothetical protein SOM61_00580 [Massilia sp. CFBP9012]|uniref:hypothetical protein n=1 Tax=Massilia sp. CFBP9012 TaxID=3096531 RepID=UPI002A698E2D|nr:hypothetical protein [Massilia sp. CFBP9012]MDY0973439.1 hypothetical protein [Massilia sp. CFBP9012]